MSTTFEIGRWPAATRRAFSHIGDGPTVTSSKARAVKRGQRSVASTTTSTRPPAPRPGCPSDARPRRILRPRRRAERRAGRGVDLACDAVDAEAVRPVRRDLELEDLRRDRQHAVEPLTGHEAACALRAARRAGIVCQHDRLVVVGADRELVLGEDHPVRRDAAQLGLFELRPIGHDGPGACDGDRLTGGHVGRSADDLCLGVFRDKHAADRETVSVGMWFGRQHAPDDERVEVRDAVMVDAVDLGAGHRKARRELARVQARVAVLGEPVQRDPHPNCSRKRTSLS